MQTFKVTIALCILIKVRNVCYVTEINTYAVIIETDNKC